MLKKYLEAGKIVGTHGVRGAVRLQPWADSGEFLMQFKRLFLDNEGKMPLEVIKIQPHGGVVIASFKKIENIEAAEGLRGKTVYLDRNDFRLPEGRYFIDDIIGCRVFNADTKAEYGILTDVSATGANDVWHITRDGKEYLVPAIAEVISEVLPEEQTVFIRPMKGIFENED